jgi:hypothetical protein
MKTYKLWLDDLRIPTKDFVWITNYNEFTEHIILNGMPEFISFDHDLGVGYSGYDCAKWLVEYCLDNDLDLPDYKVHSMNPVGKNNIESLLENYTTDRDSQKVGSLEWWENYSNAMDSID